MKKIYIIALLLTGLLLLSSCDPFVKKNNNNIINNYQFENDKKKDELSKQVFDTNKDILADKDGLTIFTRYEPPKGYDRVEAEKGSFAEYLRSCALLPYGSKAMYFNGTVKENNVTYDSVFDYGIGDKDLHHAPDAVMLLRADYLYKSGMYSDIVFSFSNGFQAEYSKWLNGYRVRVRDNEASWHKATEQDSSYENFLKYMNMIFSYCDSITLERDMKRVHLYEMQIGDVFLIGDNPGGAAIVVDMAVNTINGDKVFIVAQAGSPAQQLQIATNLDYPNMRVWFEQEFGNTLTIMDNEYTKYDLMRFN